jgi:hypothetical protein
VQDHADRLQLPLGDTAPLVRKLLPDRHIDYVELLIDNFQPSPSKNSWTVLPPPWAFTSCFPSSSKTTRPRLSATAYRLRELIDRLRPLYVSDHVARFSHEGRQLYHLAEIDYLNDYARVRERVDWWQQALGCQLLLETTLDHGRWPRCAGLS